MKKTPPVLDPKLFQLMAESVKDYAIFLLDAGGNVMSWSPGAQRAKQRVVAVGAPSAQDDAQNPHRRYRQNE